MAKKRPKKPGSQSPFTLSQRREIYETIDHALSHNMKTSVLVIQLMSNYEAMTDTGARKMIQARQRMNAKTSAGLVEQSDINRGLYILRLESIYGLAMERGDFKCAAQAAKDLAAVQGVLIANQAAGPRKVVNTNNFLAIAQHSVDNLHELSDAQLKLGLDKREVSVDQAKLLVDQSRGIYQDDDSTEES